MIGTLADRMKPELLSFVATGARIGIRRPASEDCDEFLAVTRDSAEFHRPWVDPAKTPERFLEYLRTRDGITNDGFLLRDLDSGRIVGLININCIIRGFFQSAFLGYWAARDGCRRGCMTEGLRLVCRHAFDQMGLHRLEANIQPDNLPSIALVRRCGFRLEGFSPRYLRIAGEWRDHQRWALLADDPPPAGSAL